MSAAIRKACQMRPCSRIAVVVCVACVAAGLHIAPATAQGFGSFALCYERLKQLVALLGAQGGTVVETVDEPREKRYVVETMFGERRRVMSCSMKGDLLVADE